MVRRILMTTKVSLDDLVPIDAGTISYDGLARVSEVIVNYQSITVTYTPSWHPSLVQATGMADTDIEDSQ